MPRFGKPFLTEGQKTTIIQNSLDWPVGKLCEIKMILGPLKRAGYHISGFLMRPVPGEKNMAQKVFIEEKGKQIFCRDMDDRYGIYTISALVLTNQIERETIPQMSPAEIKDGLQPIAESTKILYKCSICYLSTYGAKLTDVYNIRVIE